MSLKIYLKENLVLAFMDRRGKREISVTGASVNKAIKTRVPGLCSWSNLFAVKVGESLGHLHG